jgi:hypothetical protein
MDDAAKVTVAVSLFGSIACVPRHVSSQIFVVATREAERHASFPSSPPRWRQRAYGAIGLGLGGHRSCRNGAP